MSLTQLIIDAFAVFLVWAALLYPLISPYVAGLVRTVLFGVIVSLMGWFAISYEHPKLYAVMAIGGFAAAVQRWDTETGDATPIATVVRSRNGRVPPNGV